MFSNARIFAVLLFVLPGLFGAQAVVAQGAPGVSPDIYLQSGEQLLADEDAVYGTSAPYTGVTVGILPANADLDALHGLPNGDVLFSLDITTKLGSLVVVPADVIRFNGTTWTKEFDALAAGVPRGVNVDAVAMTQDALLFSIDITSELGSNVFSDSDVIAFIEGVFSLYQSAAALGIPDAADVDALHIDEQGDLLVSFDTSGVLDAVVYSDEDLLRNNGSDWFAHAAGLPPSPDWLPADLDAWSLIFIDEFIFSDSFESLITR